MHMDYILGVHIKSLHAHRVLLPLINSVGYKLLANRVHIQAWLCLKDVSSLTSTAGGRWVLFVYRMHKVGRKSTFHKHTLVQTESGCMKSVLTFGGVNTFLVVTV